MAGKEKRNIRVTFRCGTNRTLTSDNITVDATDLCCKTHAECHANVQIMSASCDTNGLYHAVYHNQQVQCIDNSETANYAFCMCDKQAAECFRQSLATFNSINKDISSSDICQPPSEYTFLFYINRFSR